MAKKRTKQQKIKAQHRATLESTSTSSGPVMNQPTFTFKKSDLVTQRTQPKLEVADLLMSKPAEIKADLFKTLLVTVACVICLAAWYWRLKIAGG